MKRTSDNHRIKRVAAAILGYLRDHPQAKDSTHGIAQWWVGESEEVVERALLLLIAAGVMEKRGRIYCLAQTVAESVVQEQIEKILKHLRRRNQRK